VITTVLIKKTVLGLALMCFASSAFAHSVVDVDGQVLAKTAHGKGFRAVKSDTTLPVGSKIQAKAGAKAILRYTDGCEVNIVPGQVYTVGSISPCKLAAKTTTTTTTATTGSEVDSAGGAGSLTPALVAGGVAAGLGAVVIYSIQKSASP